MPPGGPAGKTDCATAENCMGDWSRLNRTEEADLSVGRKALTTLALVTGLVVAGCAGEEPGATADTPSDTPTSSASPTTSEPAPSTTPPPPTDKVITTGATASLG